ncbi:Formyl transferase [Tylopilus felleus]
MCMAGSGRCCSLTGSLDHSDYASPMSYTPHVMLGPEIQLTFPANRRLGAPPHSHEPRCKDRPQRFAIRHMSVRLPTFSLLSLALPIAAPLKTVGESLGVPVHTIPEDKASFRKWLPPPPFTPQPDSSSFQNSSHLLITASFGRILPATILRLFPDTRRLNVHPSLLPAYRGPAPIQRALMAGERETGVCVIEMGEVNRREGKLVDAGRIWGVECMHVPKDANFFRMQEVLAVSGGKLLVQILRDMLLGRAQSRPQEAVTSTTAHAPLITARDSAIHFTSQTAPVIIRLERAIGHQRSLTVPAALPDGRGVAIAGLQVMATERVPVTSSKSECPGTAYYSPETRSLVIKCAEGTWLSVERLQTQDRAMLEAKEWWNGVKGMGWVQDGLLRL